MRVQDDFLNLTVTDDQLTAPYHTGRGRSPVTTKRRRVQPDLINRQMIAWDGEGMKISGDQRPQHYVLFGCSVEPERRLVGEDLTSSEILEYIADVGERYPKAVHIGYGFRYDSNMIVRHLPIARLIELNEKGRTIVGNKQRYYLIDWKPGKTFRVTRVIGEKRTTVEIQDMSAFFACPFLNACESILSDELTDDDRSVIDFGKRARKDNLWTDLPEVTRYWLAEIRLMQRMAERFREVMFAADYRLTKWYGPGALASYIIKQRDLRDHIQARPEQEAAHQASKRAYMGGRFEMFQAGRFTGPIYGYDINSAYPYALSQAPSLGREHGTWVHVERPTRIAEFGVYRITFKYRSPEMMMPSRAMPLFYRDRFGGVAFPPLTTGWYWSPEAQNMLTLQQGNISDGVSIEIHEGWEWCHDDTRPFAFLLDLFAERIAIGKKNVMSMPYKLGPNSMYGKFAQRVGWDQENMAAPRNHALPLAGWITSYCRAMLYRMIFQLHPSELIACETDGLYCTAPPERFKGAEFGDELGQWGIDRYEEMLYVQNGIYHRKTEDGLWLPPKSRGLDVASVSLEVVRQHLQECVPGKPFPLLQVGMRERFVGLRAAVAGSAPLRVRHCRWESGTRDITVGGTGKRIHVPGMCRTCDTGASAYDAPHELRIRSLSDGESLSYPHHLPWEDARDLPGVERAKQLDAIEEDLI